MKRFLTACAALALMVAMVLPASAAGTGGLTGAGALRDEQNFIADSPAVVFNSGGGCAVITDISVHVIGAAHYAVSLNGDLVEMFYERDLEDDLAVFQVDASYLSVPGVLSPAQSVQLGEELTYQFFYLEDGHTKPGAGSAVIVEQGGEPAFDWTLPSGVNEAQLLFPAIAVNRAGQLVVVKGEQTTIRVCPIEEGGAAPAPAPAPTPQTSDDPNPTNTKGRDDPDPTPAPTTGPGPGPNPPLSTETIAAIVISVILVVGGIVIFFKKRNSGGSNIPVQPPVQPIAPTEPMEPIRPAQPVPDSPERIEPVEIKPQPKSSALYLCCEGGVMDGRRYPVGTTTILIGRDPSCNIRYPADTKGVSRRHCEIFWKNGVLNIMDLGSTSGTFIRGKGQITANAPVAVNAGDTFYLGEKRNAFVIRMGE